MSEKITLTYLNIRQSVSILLMRLILLDLILALIIIGFYSILVQGEKFGNFASTNTSLFLAVFAGVGSIKIMLSIHVVLQWLFEYYEITPDSIIHRSGIIERKVQMYKLDKIRFMEVKDSFFGELLNYATITFLDVRLNKYFSMYLVHNPRRYAKIIKTLCPQLELKTDRIALPFMPKEEKGGEGYVAV